MNILWYILLLLPTFGFALRGIALLSMKSVKPGRLISVTGVVAAISMFVFTVVSPVIMSEFTKIFAEFDIEVPPLTGLTLSLANWYVSFGIILRCAIGLTLGICALILPEIVFFRSQSRHAGS
jgi:hypothetical protein